MQITLQNVGKRFGNDWIFRNFNYTFSSKNAYAILGANGSGKSTLLQVIAGSTAASEGTILFSENNKEIEPEGCFKHISIATPYLELIEEFTLTELIKFHFSLKTLTGEIEIKQLPDLMELSHVSTKQIKHFSSGMKQRVKLGLAIFSNTNALFLDEPCGNLDAKAIEWYQRLISTYTKDRIVIVCSNNVKEEFDFCTQFIRVEDLKANKK